MAYPSKAEMATMDRVSLSIAYVNALHAYRAALSRPYTSCFMDDYMCRDMEQETAEFDRFTSDFNSVLRDRDTYQDSTM